MANRRIPVRLHRSWYRLVAALGSVAVILATTGAVSAHADAARVYSEVYIARNVPVAMRDGVLLATDLYLPGENGHPAPGRFPTLVSRTPYGKSGDQTSGIFFARHGYAVAIQDVRGSGNSQDEFYPYIHEAVDSYDTVEWAAAQSWSNGKVGTFGISYLAATQLLMAHDPQLPPHLVTMAPGYASSSYYGDGAYAGGEFRSAHNFDYETSFAVEQYDRTHGTTGQMTPIKQAMEDLDQLYWHVPVEPFEPVIKAGDPTLEDYMKHYRYDSYWAQLNDQPYYHKLRMPVLSYGGWYDLFDQGTVQNYQGVRHGAGAAAGRSAQLVMGPYEHGNQAVRAQGMMAGEPYLFPPNSTYVDDELDLAWFDQHLKGQDAFGSLPPVRLYVPGAGFDKWIGSTDLPLPQAKPTDYYLHSGGRASIGNVGVHHLAYDGSLDTTPPGGTEPADHYTYDPRHPVITIEGYDQHWAGGVNEETEMYQDHKDILVYETPPLTQDTAVVGPITVTLYASTSAPTTDFMANLSDVDPTAHTMFVAEGARKGGLGDVASDPRNPASYATVQPLVPGKVYKWQIAIWPTGRVFAKGHRIRIDITSSDFPHFNRNLNTGVKLTADRIARAHQTVYHSAKYPSHVSLPTVPMPTMQRLVVSGPTPPGYPKDGDAVYADARAQPPAPSRVSVVRHPAKPTWTRLV